MFSKIVFVLATLCVVNASVLTVNVFNDDPDTEVASNPKGCNVQACYQLCRRLKFHGGVCVNGRCKCDNFLNAEAETENSQPDLDDSVLLKDDPETEVKANLNRCDLKVCDRVCRWLNKSSGACVDGRCKCTKSLVAEGEVEVTASLKRCTYKTCYSKCRSGNYISGACVNGRCKCSNSTKANDDLETEVETKKSDCNNQACDQLCRRLKFPGGACVNGRCKCDNFLNAEVFVEPSSNPEVSVSPRACNSQTCRNQCREIGFRDGTCINGTCYCNKYLSQQEEDIDNVEFLPPSSCNFRACDQQCFKYGYSGGTCVNGRCKCNRFRNTEDTMTDPAESVPLSSCNSIACDDQCRRTGWHSGVCINGQCKCDYFLNTEDNMSDLEESISLDDNFLSTEVNQAERSCNVRACEQLCRRLKFPGGTCVNGRCKCDNFLGTEDAVDEYSELSTRRVCRIRQCEQTCTRRGYKTARCVNGCCKCYNKIRRPDLSLLNDIFSNEIEESNVILRTDEEELVVPSPSACNSVNCNQWCRRLRYAGGWCRAGQCQCF